MFKKLIEKLRTSTSSLYTYRT